MSKTAKSQAKERVADVLNNAVDGIGNHALHLAATYGSCEHGSCARLYSLRDRNADSSPSVPHR